MLGIFVVTLARDALHLVIDEPLEAFFEQGRKFPFHTPVSAFVQMATIAGFQVAPEGLYHPAVNSLSEWPPASLESFLHELRQTFRQLMLRWTPAQVAGSQGCKLDSTACKPLSTLTRTQVNFLLTLQGDAHRYRKEQICPLCELPGGLQHALWECESRAVSLVRDEPRNVRDWPENFKQFCLLTDEDVMSPFDIATGQDFMTRVLIQRRLLQEPLDRAARTLKTRRSAPVEEMDLD
eukprot:3120746-Amphidinium_carterae.1